MDQIMKKRYDDLNIYQVASVLAVALFVPSYVVSKPQELKCPNGDPFYPDAGTVDANVSTYYVLNSIIAASWRIAHCIILPFKVSKFFS